MKNIFQDDEKTREITGRILHSPDIIPKQLADDMKISYKLLMQFGELSGNIPIHYCRAREITRLTKTTEYAEDLAELCDCVLVPISTEKPGKISQGIKDIIAKNSSVISEYIAAMDDGKLKKDEKTKLKNKIRELIQASEIVYRNLE